MIRPKMLYLGLALLLTSALANPIYNITLYDDTIDDYDGYRLPGTQIPSNYKLDVVVLKDVFENKQNTFEGTVHITFTVTEKLDYIKLHAPSEKIKEVNLKNGTNEIKIEDYSAFNTTSSILTIKLGSKLDPKTTYILTISYTGDIDSKSMYGFYRSSFINEKNETEYLLATQFEPVSARQAFPCFDEPKFKATFDISITYPEGYSALSNTPLTADPVKVGTGQLKATFKTTPKISTYLIAFIVSHFTCTQGKNDLEGSVQHQVCSRAESSDNRQLAIKWGTNILNAFDEYTGINYSKSGMTKMDQVAIPDFGAGAMENWGLVTYRERLLLYNDAESSNFYKQSIITVIAHEFTHQWFGDLVTCNWWNDIFLNEGFAAYFQYFILTQLNDLSSWELNKQFIVDQVQPVLVDDAVSTSKALTAKAASPEEVHDKFNTIAYNKGASVIRMVENIIGNDKFKTGLRNYLQKKSTSNAVPSDLLSALEEQAPKENLPDGISFSKVMENWLNLPGYPVVTVTQRGMGIIVKQNRFLYDDSSSKSAWNIPLSYTISTDKNKFDSVAPKAWLTTSSSSINNVFKNTSSWIIVNNKQSGFYRVQYTNSLWQRIAEQLKEDHTIIDVLNRAQIADDLFNFARAGNQVKYSDAFKYLEYLSKETEYYPWVSTINSLNFLLTRVGEDTSLGASLKLKAVDLLDKVYKTLSFDKDDSLLHLLSLKRDLIFNAACRYGSQDCIENVSGLFKTFKDTGKIHKNLKKVVYCHGLRNSNNPEEDWDFLWKKYQSTKLSTEQVTILGALGCTSNENSLKKYLKLSVTEGSGIRIQDIAAVWKSIYTNSPQGAQIALDYLLENYQSIMEYSKADAPTLLTGIASQYITQEQIKKVEEFITIENLQESYKSAGEASIKTATSNLAWLDNVREDLENYLPTAPTEAPPHGGGAASITALSSFVMIYIAIVQFLIME